MRFDLQSLVWVLIGLTWVWLIAARVMNQRLFAFAATVNVLLALKKLKDEMDGLEL